MVSTKVSERVKYYRRLVCEVRLAYGGRCSCCGETNMLFLQLDHAKNDGSAHRKEVGRTAEKMYIWARTNGFPKDVFQVMCANCNHGRMRNGGICPHQQVSGGYTCEEVLNTFGSPRPRQYVNKVAAQICLQYLVEIKGETVIHPSDFCKRLGKRHEIDPATVWKIIRGKIYQTAMADAR